MFRNTLRVFGLTDAASGNTAVKQDSAVGNADRAPSARRPKAVIPALGGAAVLALGLGASSCLAAADSLVPPAKEAAKKAEVSDAQKSSPQKPAPKANPSKPLPSFDACFARHAAAKGIPENLLRAIAQVESSGNPRAVAGPKGREDLGLMQINVQWLKKLGLTREELLADACLNIEVASDILRDNFERHANPWEAVGAYNAGCSKLKGAACTEARQSYAWKVWRAWKSIEARRKEST